MTTVLIIRFHYQKDDPRFAWRFAYFQSMVLPRILGQTDQNFDIAIWCNEWHDGLFRALSEKIRTFRVKAEARYRTGIGGKRYFLDFAPWKDVEGLEQYDIQAGLDSDDLVEPDFISTIHELVKKNGAENSLHISFQPGLFFVKKLATGPMRNIYGPTRGSAFMALYQPEALNQCGVVELAEDGRVLAFVEKPAPGEEPSRWANAGIYVVEPLVLRQIPPDTPFDFGADLFPLLLERAVSLYGYVSDAPVVDIGTPEGYERAEAVARRLSTVEVG